MAQYGNGSGNSGGGGGGSPNGSGGGQSAAAAAAEQEMIAAAEKQRTVDPEAIAESANAAALTGSSGPSGPTPSGETPPVIGEIKYIFTVTTSPSSGWPTFDSNDGMHSWANYRGMIHDKFSWNYKALTESELGTSTLTDSMTIAYSYSEASPLNSNYSDGGGYAMNIFEVEPPLESDARWGLTFQEETNEVRHDLAGPEPDGLRRKNGAPEDLQAANSEDREYILAGLSSFFQAVNPGATRNARSTYKKIMMEPFRGEELFGIVESEQLQYSVTGPLYDQLSNTPSTSGGGY